MRVNGLRERWSAGAAALNGWLTIPSAFVAETMAHQGWDSLSIDMQHGVIDYDAAVAMLTATATTDVVPLVRVPWLDPSMLMRVLDAGAYGVICPMVNTRADAERLVAATHYPPRGNRSYGPARALLFGGSDYLAHADETIAVFAMIETREALDNLDDIVSVPGLDAIYIGPADLSLALGCPPQPGTPPPFDDVAPTVAAAIDRILACALAHGVVAGIHNGSPDGARARIAKGFRFVTVGSDARFMAAGARAVVDALRPAGA
jgi:4-hydroxy-2-oxoheptanedioate aldolase